MDAAAFKNEIPFLGTLIKKEQDVQLLARTK
jgi:hypothetical protein